MQSGCLKYVLLLMLAAILCVLPFIVRADIGPKPSINIVVQNPPDGEYYLDLLVHLDPPDEYISNEDRAKYDSVKLGILEAYDEGGWYSCLARGTGAPMFGKLTGEMKSGKMYHKFGYMVPNHFKIIIVTPDNQVKVSQEVHKKVFHETFILDYNIMEVRGNISPFSGYFRQLMTTLGATLIIEGIVLLLFGFSLKKNWLAFLVVNLTTQVVMTAVLGTVLIRSGLFDAYFIFIPLEIGIIFAEAIAFRHLLKEHSPGRRIGYAVLANAASAVAGWLLIAYEYRMLFG